MKVELTGWRSKNLRGYLREVDVSFGKSPKRWSLVQMPNGTGKTTTMDLLRIALSGSAPNGLTINNFKADDLVETGFFEVSLLIDNEPWRIELKFNFRKQECLFFTTSTGEHSGGTRSGFDLPAELANTMTKDLSELFVFDGELASLIIKGGKKRADEAIKGLYHLDRLKELQNECKRFADVTKKNASTVTSASSKHAVHRFEVALDEAEKQLDSLKSTKLTLETKLTKDKINLQKISDQIDEEDAADTAYKEARDRARVTIRIEQQNVVDFTKASISLFRQPPLFHEKLKIKLQQLGTDLNKLKLPRTTSKEFFKQLANSETCVCGRDIGGAEASYISKYANNFLGDDQIGVINGMKTALANAANTTERFEHTAERLQSAEGKMKAAEDSLQKLEHDRDKHADTAREQLLSNKRKSELTISNAVDILFKLSEPDAQNTDGAWRKNILLCKEEADNRKMNYETALGTYEVSEKVRVLNGLIERVHTYALSSLRQRIQNTTNDYLQQILPNETLRVSSIDGHLQLTGDSGEKNSVSEGQKLAVSYAFLTALLHNAPHQLPFIVDSPAVSLDIQLRQTVVRLIPNLFDQMVMFVISSERQGFAEEFYDRSGVDYITISVDKTTGDTEVLTDIQAFKNFHEAESVPL